MITRASFEPKFITIVETPKFNERKSYNFSFLHIFKLNLFLKSLAVSIEVP